MFEGIAEINVSVALEYPCTICFILCMLKHMSVQIVLVPAKASVSNMIFESGLSNYCFGAGFSSPIQSFI